VGTLGTISLVLLIWTFVSIPLGMLVGSLLRFSSEPETNGSRCSLIEVADYAAARPASAHSRGQGSG
jgi:hypothetical protein